MRRRLPHPVATSWERVESAPEPERRSAAVACVRVIARTLVAFTLPDYLRGAPSTTAEKRIAGMRETATDWGELLDALIAAIASRPKDDRFMPELFDWYRGSDGELTVEASLFHELLVEDAAAAEPAKVRPTGTRVGELLQSLTWLAGYRPLRVSNLRTTRRRTFIGDVEFLVGVEQRRESVEGEWEAFLVPDVVYIARPKGDAFLEISPFLEVLDPEPNQAGKVVLLAGRADVRRLAYSHGTDTARIARTVHPADDDQGFDSWLDGRDAFTFFHDNVDHRGTLSFIVRSELRKGDIAAGRYEVRGELGSGGMSTVYRVWDQKAEEEVALKVLQAGLSNEPSLRERFRREALTMTKVNHRHIVRVRHTGDLEDGRLFFTMNVLDGGTLADRLKEGLCSDEEVRRWGREALLALEYLHQRDIIHRDVKPSNLLLSDRGDLRLADFGIALTAEETRLTSPLHLVGSLAYMAPEQTRGGELSSKTDIYSLAVVFHELITGAPATEGPGRGIRNPLASLVRRMGSALPAERPSASEALALLAAPAATDAPTATGSIETPSQVDAERIAKLEKAVAELLAQCDEGTAGEAEIVDGFSAVLAEAVDALRDLLALDADSDPSVYAMTLSIGGLATEMEERLEKLEFADKGAALAGLHLQLRQGLIGPAEELVNRAQAPTRVARNDVFFEGFSDGESEVGRGRIDHLMEDLQSEDELRRHDAVMLAVAPGEDALLLELYSLEPDDRDQLFATLWSYADVLLLAGRGRARVLFETAVELVGSEELRNRWKHLYALFRRTAGSYWEPSLIRIMLQKYAPEHRRVFARSLLIHPWPPYRQLAIDLLEPEDYWDVISHRETPIELLLEVWRHLKPKVGASYLKIFFVSARDRLLEISSAEEIMLAVDLLKEFYSVDVFHEDTYFDLLLAMDEPIRREGRRFGLLVDFDAEYVKRYKSFLSGGRRNQATNEEWGSVPLAVQRRLARRGHFLAYFTRHPLDVIALECLPFLIAREEVTEFLRTPGINASLLREISKEKRLFRRDDARFALVSHPKTPANVILLYIHHLGRLHLRELVRSRDCSQVARSFAQRILNANQSS